MPDRTKIPDKSPRRSTSADILARNNSLVTLPWRPHEGPPNWTPEAALAAYRAKRSDALARTVMTEEQRADYVGDGKRT
jgi:hypothetical protein